MLKTDIKNINDRIFLFISFLKINKKILLCWIYFLIFIWLNCCNFYREIILFLSNFIYLQVFL
jgi:hypothetical protein